MRSTASRKAPAPLWIGLVLCLALASCSERCGSNPQSQDPPAPPPLTQSLDFSPRVSDTAPALLARLPSDSDLVLLLANPAALAQAATHFGRWGIVNEDRIKDIQKDLQLNYGINPWDAASWARAGFRVSEGVAVASHSGHWILSIPAHDIATLERFIDMLINEEFGRPRPRQRQVGQRSIKQILIYARDFLSIACEADRCHIVTGAYFNPAASDSAELLARILDQSPANSLASNAFLSAQLKALGDGPALIFAPGTQITSKLLASSVLAALPEALSKALEATLKDVAGTCVGLSTTPDALRVRLFTDLPAATAAAIHQAVTPQASPPQPLSTLLPAPPRGLMRVTFNPQAMEAWLLGMAAPETAEKWAKIKRDKLRKKQGVFTLYDVEKELLYNLSGQALISLMRLDAEAIALAEEPEALLEAADFALFLPLKDPSLSEGLFGKIDIAKGFILEDKSVKDWLKRSHASLDITAADGAQIITFSRKGQVLLRVIHKKGILAVFTGNQYDLPTALSLLGQVSASPPWTPPKASALSLLLADQPTWGLSFDAQDMTALLGVRFKIIRTQIANVLSPLRRVSLHSDFQPTGLNLDLHVEMAPPPPPEPPPEGKP